MKKAKMIKAFRYTRHYVIDHIRDNYGETDEIFIPDYKIAVCVVDNNLYVNICDTPRTECPYKFNFNPDITEEVRKLLEKTIPERYRDFVPSPLTEIEVSLENALLFQKIAEIQEKLEDLKGEIKLEFKKYVT
jgi:hypothetical protein